MSPYQRGRAHQKNALPPTTAPKGSPEVATRAAARFDPPLLRTGCRMPSGSHEMPQQYERSAHVLCRRYYTAWERDLPCGVRGYRRGVGWRLPPQVRIPATAPQGSLRGALSVQGGVATATPLLNVR